MKIKNLNLNKDKIKLITSCTLIATTTALTMKITDIGTPFIIDNKKQTLYNVEIINSNGDTSTFLTTDKKDNLLYYYGPWQISNNNYKYREYKIYKLNTNSDKQILKTLTIINNLDSKLNSPIVEGIDYQEMISTDELNKKGYWQAFIYNNNFNNYTVIKESNLDNILTTLIYIATTTGFSLLPYIDYKEKIKEKKKV